MAAYVVRRLLWALVLLVAVTIVSFVLFFVIPTGPVKLYVRTGTGMTDINQATGVRGPIYTEYARFLWGLAHASLGRSFRGREDVAATVAAAAPVTASLVLGGALVWMLIAVPLGVLTALRPRSALDRGATILVLLGVSVHPVWISLVLLYLFGFKLHLFPLGGYCDLVNPPPGAGCAGPVQWAYHLFLPWLTFAVLFAALYVRMIRASVLETLGEEYVCTARAKGAPEWRVLRSHVLRNALLPVVTMLGMDIGVAFGGALFIETVFDLQGLGRTAYRAVSTHDLPLLLGVLIVTTTAIVILNLIVDVAYSLLDPRVRLAARPDEAERPRRSRARTPTGSPAATAST